MVRRLTASLALLILISGTIAGQRGGGQASRPRNFIILLTDDQGYGDLGSYGHPTLRTPHVDRMAAEGQRWTSFYAAPICTPSRAQLMTGRYAIRSGLAVGVLFPNSTGGLQPSEITIAEVLKGRGYATLAIGKWHWRTICLTYRSSGQRSSKAAARAASMVMWSKRSTTTSAGFSTPFAS